MVTCLWTINITKTKTALCTSWDVNAGLKWLGVMMASMRLDLNSTPMDEMKISPPLAIESCGWTDSFDPVHGAKGSIMHNIPVDERENVIQKYLISIAQHNFRSTCL